MAPTLVLFRRDLRLADNPALVAACARSAVIPVFVVESKNPTALGGAACWWLDRSLATLTAALTKAGSKMTFRRGDGVDEILALVAETGADAVFWNRRYDPFGEDNDRRLKATLKAKGLAAESFNAALLHEPWEVATKTKTPYSVFTAFYRATLAMPPPAPPLGRPKKIPGPTQWPRSLDLADLDLKPKIAWDTGLAAAWQPGEEHAHRDLAQFFSTAMMRYKDDRDVPAVAGTSRMAPRLAFGEISPRSIWHTLHEHLNGRTPREGSGPATFLKELGWREFAYHLLHYNPKMTSEPLNAKFVNFPWEDRPDWLKAWQRGRTGYPIVDAGMRELWVTGTMHNRVRMIVASFLVKHLLTPWQHGAAWFWDTLVDADLASNSQNWQWCAGCGVDAAPYFRIFNPMLQGAKFDPEGEYVRRWLPALARLPKKFIHQPWDAPLAVAKEAGLKLGDDYPQPIVDHGAARMAALVRYERMRRI